MNPELRPCDLLDPFRLLARVPPHRGRASFSQGEETFSGAAEFLLPAGTQAIVAFQSPAGLTSQDFGRDFVLEGSDASGAFRIECAQIYVREPTCPADDGFWNLISPVNGSVRVRYGDARQVRRAIALLNNFDFSTGDAVSQDDGWTRIDTPLSVDADGRAIMFRQRPDRSKILPLLKAGLLKSGSLVELAFEVVEGEGDDDHLAFAGDVAGLCTVAAGTGTSVALLDLLDENGALVRRLVPRPVEARYRSTEIVADPQLRQLFLEGFAEYRRMKRAHPPWQKLASYCGSLEEAPFLEQKFASVVMAIEFFLRNCLVEKGHPEAEVMGLDFAGVIGAARKHLRWPVPRHYLAKDTARLLRNAVVHGGTPPTADNGEFRMLLDKWRLFFFRCVLIRLGYSGSVVSPHKGWESSSSVDDFSQEKNDFEPADLNVRNPWKELAEMVRASQG